MRPLPAHILKRFPAPPNSDRIPDRPWWFLIGHGKWMRINRDGTATSREGIPACADFDREHPLAHPGFRPGQVWALEYTQLSVQGTLEASFKRGLFFDKCHSEGWHDYANWQTVPSGFSFAGVVLTQEEFNHLFMSVPHYDAGTSPPVAYLLSDPCCSHLAPWSPAEGA